MLGRPCHETTDDCNVYDLATWISGVGTAVITLVDVFQAFSEVRRILVGIFDDSGTLLLVVFFNLWSKGVQVTKDYVRSLQDCQLDGNLYISI